MINEDHTNMVIINDTLFKLKYKWSYELSKVVDNVLYASI